MQSARGVGAEARSLSIQSILYETDPESALRVARSAALAAASAVSAGVLSNWELAFGDSSATPMLDDPTIRAIDETIAQAGGRFRYEFFGSNLGHGGGHNQLATAASTDLMLFVNPDALLGPDTLVRLASAVVDTVGVADARQVPLEHPKDYTAAGGDASWSAGACMMTPRTVFETVRGFDSATFFMYCDDVDYSWRVRLAGFRSIYVPAARVFHDKRMSATATYVAGEVETYYSAEAALLLAYKYSNPRLVRSLIREFRRYGTEPALRAVGEFRARRSAGSLPVRIDADHRVAQFVGPNYGPVRFSG